MDKIKRIITTVIGLPIVILALAYSNKYIIDTTMMIVAVISMHEYINCAKEKNVKVIKWISYLSTFYIAFIHLIPNSIFNYWYCVIPILLSVLFAHIIISDMKITLEDIAYTFWGICYIVGFVASFALVYGYEGSISGKIFIWFVIVASWGTDMFAYMVGMRFGKTKFTHVSPNKSVQGCVGGTVAAIVLSVILSIVFNRFFGTSLSLVVMGVVGCVLSIMGQLGDLSASAIKRYFGVKDFSSLFPGHGGMLDRIDSVMFIAPVAFLFLNILF
ncbi:MAG: phosphatidate cytidylyltransferase [Clostridia bacterium]|nr:phosphatidate cytidylyltransferase [Clostridia bacterium]